MTPSKQSEKSADIPFFFRFFPGAIYYLSAWYNKTELGKRIAALYIAQQFGNAFGGLFAAGVFKLDGKHGIRAWQWLVC